MKPILILLFSILYNSGISQCIDKITHISGAQVVSGINIKVSSAGIVDTNTTECKFVGPYVIGQVESDTSGPGYYKFEFSPAVDSLTLNFFGITDYGVDGIELVKIYVNGMHYAVTSVGSTVGCDLNEMAIITQDGDIGPCKYCALAGWRGTTIRGKISSLLLLDTSSNPLFHYDGTGFSLYIAGLWRSGIPTDIQNVQVDINPNPFKAELNVSIDCNELTQLVLYDITGKKQFSKSFQNNTTIETNALEKGIYFYEILNTADIIKRGKLVKE